MRCFFNKNNAFNSVLFGSVVLLAVIRTLWFKDDILVIANVLGLLTFIFSSINTVTSIFDDIINYKSQLISDYDEMESEYCLGVDDMSLYEYMDNKYFTGNSDLNDLCIDFEKGFLPKKHIDLILILFFVNKRIENQRKIRRFFLYCYYAVLMFMLLYLFLASELVGFFSGINLGEWTLWSFVMILFDIMIKDQLADAIIAKQEFDMHNDCEKAKSRILSNNNNVGE